MDPANKDLYQIILIGADILVAILVYFVVAIIRQQRKVYHWQQDRIAAEITTLENERKRIAADLHDELGPVLSAVRLQINHLEPEDETEKMVLARSTSQIDEVIQRFREISYDLMPNTLLRKGLSRAVEEFAEKMQLGIWAMPEYQLKLYTILSNMPGLLLFRLNCGFGIKNYTCRQRMMAWASITGKKNKEAGWVYSICRAGSHC